MHLSMCANDQVFAAPKNPTQERDTTRASTLGDAVLPQKRTRRESGDAEGHTRLCTALKIAIGVARRPIAESVEEVCSGDGPPPPDDVRRFPLCTLCLLWVHGLFRRFMEASDKDARYALRDAFECHHRRRATGRRMSVELLTKGSWFALGVIHLLPALSAFSTSLLTRLYGPAPSVDLRVLLAHRGVLFCAVLMSCVFGALSPATRRPLSAVVAISIVGFLLLYLRAGSPAGPLRTLAIVDALGLAPLALVLWAAWTARGS
jgi:hypothetical protein